MPRIGVGLVPKEKQNTDFDHCQIFPFISRFHSWSVILLLHQRHTFDACIHLKKYSSQPFPIGRASKFVKSKLTILEQF